jgi:AraC-like DNA-binding protein
MKRWHRLSVVGLTTSWPNVTCAARDRSAAAVRHMMVEHLGETTVTPEIVARALAVSQRTLSRRLADEGTSFRHILDDVRREFACALLHDRTLSVADVAFFLGYSEPAAFNRSFRRWTGQTPRAFRSSKMAAVHQRA